MTAVRPVALAFAALFVAAGASAQSATPTPEIAGFIVTYAPGTAEAANANIAARRLADASRQVARSGLMAKRGPSAGLGYQRRLSVGGDVLRATRLLALDEAAAARAALAAQPGVARVEYDYVLQASLRPNDTRYAEQWAMTDADAGLRAEAAWDLSTGTGVIIGVLDTGLARHTDLDANVVPGYDFITSVTTAGDGNGRDADASDPGDFANGRNSSWHGTHVAGIAAARGNNAAGIAGLAFSAKVMPVRVLGRGGGTTSDIADAIVWASGGAVAGVPTLSAANAADVLNLSLGGPGTCTSALQSAIASAASRGVPVVVAAGNDARDAGGYTPANCPGVITVAAVGANSARASFSNFGAVVDVAAPGVSILSTANAGTQVPGGENFLAYSGTSMAAPYVSATLALVQSRRTALRLAPLTVADQEALLKRSTYASAAGCSGCGAGLLSAQAAVQAAGGASTTPTTPTNPATPTNPTTPTTPTTPGTTFTQTFLNLTASTGTQMRTSIAVPAGARDLRIETSGGTGNADLFVGQGTAPTTAQATCKANAAGNAGLCAFATPVAGTYHVLINATAAFSGMTVKISYVQGGSTTPATFANDTDVAIRDNATAASPINVSGRAATLSAPVTIDFALKHPASGELKVELVMPDGLVVLLHNRAGGATPNLAGRISLQAPGRAANGTWTLRVTDQVTGNTGLIDRWSLAF